MTLSDHQWAFLTDISRLIAYAEYKGIKMTAGEAFRTKDQQLLYYEGKHLQKVGSTVGVIDGSKRSWTMKSNHLRRLAMDFNFFIDGELTYDVDKLKELGDYWESLHQLNRWGGYFTHTDTPHFERNV